MSNISTLIFTLPYTYTFLIHSLFVLLISLYHSLSLLPSNPCFTLFSVLLYHPSSAFYVSVCLSVSVSVCTSVCLCVRQSVCLSLCLSVCLYLYLFLIVSLSICLPLCMHACMYVWMSLSLLGNLLLVCLSFFFFLFHTSLPLSMSVCLSVCTYESLNVCMFICMYHSLSLSQIFSLFVCLSICSSFSFFATPSACLYLFQSFSLSPFLSICLRLSWFQKVLLIFVGNDEKRLFLTIPSLKKNVVSLSHKTFSKSYYNFFNSNMHVCYIIVDLRLVIRSKCCYEKKQMRWCSCGNDILINSIHPAYCLAFLLCVYANLCIDAISLSSDILPFTLSLSLSLCLCLSAS